MFNYVYSDLYITYHNDSLQLGRSSPVGDHGGLNNHLYLCQVSLDSAVMLDEVHCQEEVNTV